MCFGIIHILRQNNDRNFWSPSPPTEVRKNWHFMPPPLRPSDLDYRIGSKKCFQSNFFGQYFFTVCYRSARNQHENYTKSWWILNIIYHIRDVFDGAVIFWTLLNHSNQTSPPQTGTKLLPKIQYKTLWAPLPPYKWLRNIWRVPLVGV